MQFTRSFRKHSPPARRRLSNPVVFVLGALTALALGGTAFAANGSPVLIGRVNSGTTYTGLSNSNGSALALYSKAGTPSFAVNRTTKIPNLNADMIDGVHATSLALVAGRTGTILGSVNDVDGLPFTAQCPNGSVATGGGGVAPDVGDHLWYSGPSFNPDTGALIPNSWLALSDNSDSVAWVICYNPRGVVPGAVTSLSAPGPSGMSVMPGASASRSAYIARLKHQHS